MHNSPIRDSVTHDMMELSGKLATITGARHKYILDIDTFQHFWTDEMLLPASTRIAKTKPITQGENICAG